MSNILPQNEIKTAQAWLHDIFVWAGMATPKRAIPIEKYKYMYGTHPSNFRTQSQVDDDNSITIKKSKDCAVTICDFICKRIAETQRFQKLDEAVSYLSKAAFLPTLDATSGYVTKTPEELCKYIAWFCDARSPKWLFNNKNTSVEEMKQIQTTTIGRILWDNYLFLQDRIPEANPNYWKEKEAEEAKANAEKAKATTQAQSEPAPQQAPQPAQSTAAPEVQPSQPVTSNGILPDGTKQSDARHTLYRSNAKGLVDYGKPKETNIGINGKVFRVSGIGKTPTEITLNVQPQGGSVPLKVRYTVGSAWNDCKLYFKTNVDADRFMGKALAVKPAEIQILQVKGTKEDPNGYVEVITEFGNAYIQAGKLHENLEEEIDSEEDSILKEYKSNKTNKEIADAIGEAFAQSW